MKINSRLIAETMGDEGFDERAYIRKHELKNFENKISIIVSRLEELSEKIKRIQSSTRMTPMEIAKEINHEMNWTLANMSVHDLYNTAHQIPEEIK